MAQNSKAIIQDGSKEEQESALQTLYSALEAALVLSHPFLPFITEELWQRLPRRPDDDTASIMIARYPTSDESLDNASAEAAYQLVLDCSAAIRSLKAEFPSKDEAQSTCPFPLTTPPLDTPANLRAVVIQTFDPESHQTATAQVQAVRALSGKGATAITVVDAAAARPAGSVAFAVSSIAAVFLHVRDRVDLDAELTKARAKLARAGANAAKTAKLLADPGYLEKVAAATQDADQRRLRDQESEVHHLEETIRQFEALKLEA